MSQSSKIRGGSVMWVWAFMALAVLGFSSCKKTEDVGAMEELGKKMDEKLGKAGKKFEEQADKVEKKLEQMGAEIEKGAEKVKGKIAEGADKVSKKISSEDKDKK
ncbi:MAG: hypothetical protein L3J39_16460 [Verrucomicrobiales bacterium]|nr:hypothetical protein [Verrucomicrobiales bacterium]